MVPRVAPAWSGRSGTPIGGSAPGILWNWGTRTVPQPPPIGGSAPGTPTGVAKEGLDHKHAGELTLGAGHRRERGGVHAGDGGEHALQLEEHDERPLRRLRRLARVERGEAGHSGAILVDLGVVLHRAAPERVEAGVDAVVEPAERGEVAHDLELGQLRERDVLSQERGVGQGRLGYVAGGELHTLVAGGGEVEGEGAHGRSSPPPSFLPPPPSPPPLREGGVHSIMSAWSAELG